MRGFPLLLTAGLALAGCAGTRVALLDGEASCFDPATQGDVQCVTGSVAVIDEAKGTDIAVLDRPFARGRAGGSRASVSDGDAEQLNRRYAGLFETLPRPPRLFVFYFNFDSDRLPEESKPLVAEMFREISTRPGVDVTIVGHTDRMGDATGNDKLSLDRANAIRDQLIALGLDPDIATTAGRGEREPIERLGEDNVPSQQNRRVEVFVR